MKIDKKIRLLPWQEPWRNANERIHFTVTLQWPVVDHERLLVADFRRNTDHKMWRQAGKDFRLILSKKEDGARILYKGDRCVKRHTLTRALDGFGTFPAGCYPEISERDEAALRKWLGTRGASMNHFIPELSSWVDSAIDREVQAEEDARGEIRDEDVKLCPEGIPEGLVDYIRREMLPEDKVLLYKKGNVRGRCFLCGEQVRAVRTQRFRQNEPTNCPNCGQRVMAYLETSDRFKVDYVQNVATIQTAADGKTVFIRHWHIIRDKTAQWEDIGAQLQEVARYAIRGEKTAKWQCERKENWYMNTWRTSLSYWERMRNVTESYDGSYEFYLPPNWKELLQGTSLRYIDLEGYMEPPGKTYTYRNVIRFCIDWARYPAVEKLWKAGYKTLIHNKISGISKDYRSAIRWGADTIGAACGFALRYLKAKPAGEWDVFSLKRTKDLAEEVKAGHITDAEMQELIRTDTDIQHIHIAMGHASIHKILKYLDGQIEKERQKRQKEVEAARKQNRYCESYRASETTGTYRDYLRECVELALDLDDKAVLFPKDLRAAHARATAQVRYKANEEKQAAFEKQRAKLMRMCFEADGLMIRPASDAKELIAEGAYLNHCVGGYADRMADGKLAIFLIRRTEEPDVPYYTLEWNDNRIIQCRTKGNRDYINCPEVLVFVQAWRDWVLAGCRKRKKKAAKAA